MKSSIFRIMQYPRYQIRAAAIPVLALSLILSRPVQAGGVLEIRPLNGTDSVTAHYLNAAGDVVVGYADGALHGALRYAYRWTPATGMVSLGALNGGNSSEAFSVNAVGDVIVGDANDGAAGNATRAFRWTQATGMVSLGVLNGGNLSEAHRVNAAGDVIVGDANDGAAGNASRAFRWTQATGMVSLGTLGGGLSDARGVSAAGDVITGSSNTALEQHAYRWTQATGMVDLGTLNGGNLSRGYAINAAGDVIVGMARDGAAGNATRAYRWTQATGMVSLGTLAGGTASQASGVNAAGDVIVGVSYGVGTSGGFRWTPATGMQSIEQWLADNGVAVAGVQVGGALTTNAAGNVVIGILSNGHEFIARVGSDFGVGLMDVQEVNTSLINASRISSQSVSNTDTALNGHYGTPMLLPEGRYRVWVGGVAGRQSTGHYDANLGLGEFGIAKNLSANTQLSFSIGGNYGKTNTGFGGQTIERSTYALPELLVRLPETSLYATVSGYYASGNTDINRGYLNAGTEVQSRGKASTYTLAGRLSLDWANAATWLGTDFSPYVSLTHVEHHTGAYTETGGGFPVAWNARAEHATTARLGTGMTHPLNDNLTLLGRAEVAHRFQTTSANVSGQVLGLYGFTLPGENTHQNWVQTGVGLESHMLDGIGSVMLHGSTQGQAPQYWISASYRKTF